MTKNQINRPVKKRKSKHEKRMKIMVYIMIIAMLLSTLSAGLAFIL